MTLVALAVAATAIVDSAAGVDGVAPLQLLAPGTELVVPAGARVRLAYFASCVHETVADGTIRIGVTASLAGDAVVERVTVDCGVPTAVTDAAVGALVLRGAADTGGVHYEICLPRGCVRVEP